MTQVTFSAATTPQLTDLDANFTQLYNLREVFSTPGYVAATPKISLDSSGNWGLGISPGANVKLFMSDGTISSFVGYNYATNTISGFGTNTAHAVGILVGGAEKARIDTTGNWLVGTTSAASSNSNSFLWLQSSAFALMQHISGTASGAAYAAFNYNATQIGSIAQSGTTAIVYNTTSDYRLKNNTQPLSGSGAFIDALKPKTWSWAQDGSRGCGFIAHEFAEVSPTSVSGAKDAVDAEGAPVYQAMDASTPEVIANIIAELQDLRRRVATLGG